MLPPWAYNEDEESEADEEFAESEEDFESLTAIAALVSYPIVLLLTRVIKGGLLGPRKKQTGGKTGCGCRLSLCRKLNDGVILNDDRNWLFGFSPLLHELLSQREFGWQRESLRLRGLA